MGTMNHMSRRSAIHAERFPSQDIFSGKKQRSEYFMGKEVKTNAMRILDKNKIPYEI